MPEAKQDTPPVCGRGLGLSEVLQRVLEAVGVRALFAQVLCGFSYDIVRHAAASLQQCRAPCDIACSVATIMLCSPATRGDDSEALG